MTQSLRLAVRTSPDVIGSVPASDVVITCDPQSAVVADLAELVGFPRGPLLISGHQYAGSTSLAETSVHDGSVIENPADLLRPDVTNPATSLVTIKTIAGKFTGRRQSLGPGSYSRTSHGPIWVPATGPVADAILTLTIPRFEEGCARMGGAHDGGIETVKVTVTPGVGPAVLGGAVLTCATPVELSDIPTVLNLGTERLALTAFLTSEAPRREAEAALHRVPRIAQPAPRMVFSAPDIPSPPGERPVLSWITMLAPIPMALLMALMIGRRALIFGLMSPVMVLSKLWENRRVYAARTAEYETCVAAARVDFYDQIVSARTAATDHALALNPGPSDLVERALETDPRLWERRPLHKDFGTLVVGYADRPWRYSPVTETGQDVAIASELADIADGFSYLASVPVTADLRSGSLGIVGDRTSALGVVRGVVVALTTLSGPADTPLVLIAGEEGLDDWDWTKWLPHLGSPARLGSAPAEIEAILGKAVAVNSEGPGIAPSTRPLAVLVIDGVEQLRRPDSPLRKALSEGGGTTGIVIAESEEDLPASCNWVLSIDGDGMAILTDISTGIAIPNITPVGMDAVIAASTARSMAHLTDPDVETEATELPSFVSLAGLLAPTEAGAILERWEQCGPDANPIAAIGIGSGGPLLVDLVHDGPHALLAGTTGAGKSELLRSFVLSIATQLSPEQVNFVLVDYKGGGAFDVCAELPHTVATVTDLDGHLGARALRSLQAELRFREVTFRAAGARDLCAFRAGGGVMPRLVVMVDEFATLATELPDFLDALVDIAQRGRSLGIHMVLATQRPAGVLDAKIKSNTNLRICLRVQDDSDSIDVIGTNQAARLGRTELGRGFIRMGASQILPFQAAYTGGVTPPLSLSTGVSVEEFRLRPLGRIATGSDHSAMPSDMERMVGEVVLANDKANLSAPRKPWLPELPTRLSFAELREGMESATDRTAPGRCRGVVSVGLLDMPAEQRRQPLQVDVSAGNTIIYGADQATTSATLMVLGLQLLDTYVPEDLHLYLLDSGSAGLGGLQTAPHVGAYILHDDDELLNRAFDLLDGLLAERKDFRAAGGDLDTLPLTVVLVEGFGALLERLNDGADHAMLTRVGAFLRTGANLGVALIGTASHDRQIPGRLSSQIGTKLVHQLTDPSAIVSFGLRQRDVPNLSGSMIVEVATGLTGVSAFANLDELASIVNTARPATHRPPKQLRLLQPALVASDLEVLPTNDDRTLTLPIGVRIRDIETATLAVQDRAVILGQSGTGRTTALLQLTRQAAKVLAPESIAVVTHESSPLATIEGIRRLSPDSKLDEDQVSSLAECSLLVVDDAERLNSDLGDQLKSYVDQAGPGRWILASMRPSNMKALSEWTSVLRGTSTGVLLKPLPTDGDCLRVMLVKKMVTDLRIGQGILVANGEMTPIQLAQ